MGAPKYRTPLTKKKPQDGHHATKEEVDKLTNKLTAELKKPEQQKKMALIIEELLKHSK